jgi:hypothetical protein
MTDKDLQVLKENLRGVVRIIAVDGETMLVKVHAVSEEDADVIYDVISTDRGPADTTHAYLIKFKDIQRVEATAVGPSEH